MERDGLQKKSIECVLLLIWIRRDARGTLPTSTVTLGYPRGPTRPEKNKDWLRLSVKHPRTEWLLAGFIFETPHVMMYSVVKYKE